jgi:DNA-binding NarL/FixJ family response regulator
MLRQGLRTLLECCPDLDIVGEASDGEEAIHCIASLRPSVVVMDINMPKMNGIEATRLIKNQHPHIAVVGLSLNTDGHHVETMVKAGAVEVVTKEKAVDDLYASIRRAVVRDIPSASGASS